MMFSQEQMEQWEDRCLTLDGQGESEAYFPLWGIVDVDEYLQKSDAARNAREQARGNAEHDTAESSEGHACGGNAVAADAIAELPVSTKGVRIAWGALFWLKRVIAALLVFAVGSLLVTMALNPTLTFFEAAEMLFGGVIELMERARG